MRVLLTGGTGFLGKYVLTDLVEDSRITEVIVVTRSQSSHPSPKVKILTADLTRPTSINLIPEVDAVIHLAGLYSFETRAAELYEQNVLPALNLLARLKQLNQTRVVPVLVASTYAVGLNSNSPLTESALEELPPRYVPYAYTKAISEKIFSDSKLPVSIFRLGILVGDTQVGRIEKSDGPYYFMNFIEKARGYRVLKNFKQIPIPGDPEGILPFVPVDEAARVFKSALFKLKTMTPGPKFYGVYNPSSVRMDAFCDWMFEQSFPKSKPTYVTTVPRMLLRLQSRVSKIPPSLFQFSGNIELQEPTQFQSEFPECPVSNFLEYREVLRKGFKSFYEGRA